ncbi:hypothetical protein HPULCUR_009335 [Helicostylum pulchrum]|uniref:Uncharacterized protein n=1 Tax=Helicostylum pulchrum TaxID=562976 RepID=A0ABP9YA57_9FUNG
MPTPDPRFHINVPRICAVLPGAFRVVSPAIPAIPAVLPEMIADTRLKGLLRYVCYNVGEQIAVIVARSIMFIFSSTLDIKIVGDGPNEFEEAPASILRALCSSRNLFVCDFMLRYLTTSANTDDIIGRHDLNELLNIDTVTDEQIANLLNQKFMSQVK